MPSAHACSKCGAELPSHISEGLCPKCSLLAAVFQAPPPGVTESSTEIEPTPEELHEKIGPYKILQKIGEGGCGVVYMAEQEEPVRRRVALKVIKLGMDTNQVVARFEAERQALALMDHPNIAKIFDAGATETGRPYFVMELVKGVRITDYCDDNKLSTVARLGLFIQVCQAVQHAHQKGIIHRDIKPSNILVADHDGAPVPKIIDFGIAKATTDQRLTDQTLFTALEQFIGTPAYMSPEQAKLSGLDIDTRSDIYSLGVLLYELLTGSTPFDAKRLMEAGLDGIRHIIREEDPPKPSTRLSTLDAAEQTVVAQRRRSEPPTLLGIIRGDLDWIVMKALEKDRNRRYETSNGLAMDIQRLLANEPVIARPSSRVYRFRKFARRNRLTVMTAAITSGVLVLGVLVSTWQAVRATHAEREQNRMRAMAERAQEQETLAHRQAETNAWEVKRLLRRTYVANASAQAEHGDLAGSLPWLVEALKLAANDPKAEENIRINIGMTTRELPVLDCVAALDEEDLDRDLTAIEHTALNQSLVRNQMVVLSPDCRSFGIVNRHAGWQNTTRLYTPETGGFVERHSGAEKSAVILYDSASGKPKTKPLLMNEECEGLQFSRDGHLVMGTTFDGVYIWQADTGALFLKIPSNRTAQFSGDGQHLLLTSDNRLSVWDLNNKTEATSSDFTFTQGPERARERLREFSERYRRDAESGSPQSLNALAWFLATCEDDSFRNGREAIVLAERAVAATKREERHLFLDTLAAAHAEVGNFTNAARMQKEAVALCKTENEKTDFISRLNLYSSGHPYHQAKSDPVVRAANWSRDGRFVYYKGSMENYADSYLWDTVSKAGFLVPSPEGEISSAEFSPNGRLLVCFHAQSRSISLLDTESRKLIQTPPGFKATDDAQGQSAIFSKNGQLIILVGADLTPRIWDTRSWQPRTGPLIHSSRPVAAVFSADGTKLATMTEAGTLRIWVTNSGEPLSAPFEVPLLKSKPSAVASTERWFMAFDFRFTDDNKFLVLASASGAWVWRLNEPKTLLASGTNALRSLELSSDGNRILLAYDTGAAIVDVVAGLTERTLGEQMTSATWSSNGSTILTEQVGHNEPRLCLWDAASGMNIATNIEVVFQTSLGTDAGLTLRMECNYRDSTGSEQSHGSVHGQTGLGGLTNFVLIPPLRFTISDSNDAVRKIELRDSLSLPTYVALVPVRNLLIVGRNDNSVLLYSITNGRAVGPVLHQSSYLLRACFSPGGQKLATLAADGALMLWNVDSWNLLGLVRVRSENDSSGFDTGSPPEIGFSKDANYIVARTYFDRVLETPNGKNDTGSSDYWAWRIYEAGAMAELYSPPSASILGYGISKSASADTVGGRSSSLARVFDRGTRKVLTPPLQHSGRVLDVRLSPDERFVATASEDETTRVWDADSGEPVSPPLHHGAPVKAVAFFPDNRRFISGASDGVLKIWNLEPLKDSARDLELLAELQAGRHLDESGGLVPLSEREMSKILRLWLATHPSRFPASHGQ